MSGTILAAACFPRHGELYSAARHVSRMTVEDRLNWQSDRAGGRMFVLHDWSWQMRRCASANRGERKGLRRSLVDASKQPGATPVLLEAGVQAHIGDLLREMYDSALKETVPQRFLDLLRQMDAKTDGPPPAARQGEPK